MPKIIVVMYHYVRDLANSSHPEIKGLDVRLFREQLQHLMKNYPIIRMEELIDAIHNHGTLPATSALLTFDDGYSDHYQCVYPILKEAGVQGSFFPPARAITEKRVLDVNKIHFILASVKDKALLMREILDMVDKLRTEYCLSGVGDYLTQMESSTSRFDTREVSAVKTLLQKGLPEVPRTLITDMLFRKHVTENEALFAQELYMNIEQLKVMRKNGMHIGSHGYDHFWLNTLSKERQHFELKKSIEFLNGIGSKSEYFTFCYPYGAYNDSLIDVLEERQCRLAFTTEVGVAELFKHEHLLLPRIDTNDLPKDKNAYPLY